jgi:hypothetical protein
MDLEESIEYTKTCVIESLQQKRTSPASGFDISLDFITKECLARPPFSFIHALITIYVQHLSFASGLYDDEDFILTNFKARRDKIRFIFKMLVCIAKLTKERLDIFVSPVKLLAGQEVNTTHMFLRSLAKASSDIPSDASAKAAGEVMELGENELYKKSVKTRNTITKFQAVVRGNFGRRRIRNGVAYTPSFSKIKKDGEKYHCGMYQCVAIALGFRWNDLDYVDSSCTKDIGTMSHKNLKTVNDITDLSRNGVKAKIQIFSGNGDSKTSLPQISGKTHVRTQNNGVQKTHQTKSTRTKKLKKCKIINGVVTRQELVVTVPTEEQLIIEKERKKTLDELDAELKRKSKRLKDREAKLNLRLQKAKEKEEHLQLHDERVKRLADNLRKQQNKLKQDGLQQALEMDKLRLEIAHRPSDRRLYQTQDTKDIPVFSDELLRQASENKTITDLRLALERKERSMQKRQERMARAEKALQQRILEFEEMESASHHIESKSSVIPKHTARIVKKAKKILIHSDEDNIIRSPAPILDLVNETNRRRHAVAPATLSEPQELAQSVYSENKDSDLSPVAPLNIPNSKHQLSTIVEEGEIKKKSPKQRHSLPRSLINYTNHRNENLRQNFVALGH